MRGPDVVGLYSGPAPALHRAFVVPRQCEDQGRVNQPPPPHAEAALVAAAAAIGIALLVAIVLVAHRAGLTGFLRGEFMRVARSPDKQGEIAADGKGPAAAVLRCVDFTEERVAEVLKTHASLVCFAGVCGNANYLYDCFEPSCPSV